MYPQQLLSNIKQSGRWQNAAAQLLMQTLMIPREMCVCVHVCKCPTLTMSSPMTIVKDESMVVETSLFLKSMDTKGKSDTARYPCTPRTGD